MPLYLFDAELDDALFSPLFIQEQEEAGDRQQIYPFFEKVCCQLSPCLSFTLTWFAEFTQQKETKFRLRKRANHDFFSTTKKTTFR